MITSKNNFEAVKILSVNSFTKDTKKNNNNAFVMISTKQRSEPTLAFSRKVGISLTGEEGAEVVRSLRTRRLAHDQAIRTGG